MTGKRALAAIVAVFGLAGCGGKAPLPTLDFESRPDLSPPPLDVLESSSAAASG